MLAGAAGVLSLGAEVVSVAVSVLVVVVLSVVVLLQEIVAAIMTNVANEYIFFNCRKFRIVMVVFGYKTN